MSEEATGTPQDWGASSARSRNAGRPEGKVMHSEPTGPELDEDECRALDDTFYSSDPTGYFRSKIDSLLDSCVPQSSSQAEPTADRQRFGQLLGARAVARSPVTEDQRELQVAVDAILLRHQVAETLLRHVHARLTCRASQSPTSVWMTLTQSPIRLHDAINQIRPTLEADDFFPIALGLFIPVPDKTNIKPAAQAAVVNGLAWISRAVTIVSSGQLDLNAANNKIKHGVCARPEDKLRITLTTEPPNGDGNVRLSSLTGNSAINIVDSVVLEYISQPPKVAGQERAGFERTLLRVDPTVVLAEAWMLAATHGAIFHTGAYRHFGDRDAPGVADYPGISAAPTPQQVLGDHVVGMRFPITTSTSGQVHRPAGFQRSNGTFYPLAFKWGTKAVVVDG